ncbi:hypothetical protein GCM10010430_04240 [Kitasatospora cystarginea]|uniref:Uncharacterized protein n=1 Tax=Kitasatospora cystarginea TaxID=58350 RepID=A0ABN3DD21_9ACTN
MAWHLRDDRRRAAIGTGDPQPAVDRVHPVVQALQSVSLAQRRAAHSVVRHPAPQASPSVAHPDRAPAGVAVLGHIGQGLGDHEIRGRLDRGVRPPVHGAGIELDGDDAARGQGGERRPQSSVGEDRRGDAARQGP